MVDFYVNVELNVNPDSDTGSSFSVKWFEGKVFFTVSSVDHPE